ncbi:MAG TPA: hypothetical protein PLK67_04615 [Bryobacteraceae bacterium]|nr:hypothetical protein [Bryobacteraceae bacterium]
MKELKEQLTLSVKEALVMCAICFGAGSLVFFDKLTVANRVLSIVAGLAVSLVVGLVRARRRERD